MDESSNDELMVILHEALAGIRLVKSLCRGAFRGETLYGIQRRDGHRQHEGSQIHGHRRPLIEGMGGIGVMAALVYVSFTHMPFSKFVALLGSLFLLYNPVKKLSKVHVSLQKALGATFKIFELLDTPASITDAPDAPRLKNCQGEIEFDRVTFAYNVARPPALRGVSLHIQPGKSYALVGASGAGKSTMFSLLLRFYDPNEGCIRMDGRDLRSITQKSLRESIGMVSQDTFLFHETILENIRYGRLDATDEEIYEAARQAYAHDFILEQPKGYQTVIGDKGCLISGGQQQRLAIARALLKNAPVLLLDEATSALDSESEKEIQAALERLSAGRTVIAIAHRLSTILKADQIVVMHQGEIKKSAATTELLDTSVLYRRLYDLQFNRHPIQPREAPFESSAARHSPPEPAPSSSHAFPADPPRHRAASRFLRGPGYPLDDTNRAITTLHPDGSRTVAVTDPDKHTTEADMYNAANNSSRKSSMPWTITTSPPPASFTPLTIAPHSRPFTSATILAGSPKRTTRP